MPQPFLKLKTRLFLSLLTLKCKHTRGHTQSCPCPARSDWWFQEGAFRQGKSSLGQASSTHWGMSTICMYSQVTHTHSEVHPPHYTVSLIHSGIHSCTHFDMWYCVSRAVYYIMYSISSAVTQQHVSERARRGGAESRRRVEASRATQAQCALYSFRLHVPLWASMGLCLTVAITTNNWTANEYKWYDCSARPSSQSAI